MVKLNTSEFLKATEVTENMTVEFVDEGSYSDSQFKDANDNPKQNFNITVKFGEEERIWTMNKTSQRDIAGSYGDDTKEWVGQTATLSKVVMMVGKEQRDVIFGKPASEKLEKGKGWDE